MTRIRYLGRHITIKGVYVKDIVEGRKRTTIRKGIVKPKYCEVILHGGGKPVAKLLIERVCYKKLRDLTNSDASRDGFSSREELVRVLKKTYLNISENDWITIIEFRVVQRLDSIGESDRYMGLKPVDIARIGLRYLRKELSESDRRILIELTRAESIRAVAHKLYGDINKRYIVRKVLKKVLNKLVYKGVLKKSVGDDVLDSQVH